MSDLIAGGLLILQEYVDDGGGADVIGVYRLTRDVPDVEILEMANRLCPMDKGGLFNKYGWLMQGLLDAGFLEPVANFETLNVNGYEYLACMMKRQE